jgi:tetratricopeptide (TPR) repeat protein
LSDINKAIELEPDREMNWFHRGYIYEKLGNDQRSLADYNKTLSINPNYAWAVRNRGYVKSKLQDFSGALADYSKAIELDPKDYWTWGQRGKLKYETEDTQGALLDLNKAIILETGIGWLWAWRGYAKKKLEDNRGALSDFTKALQLDGNDSWSRYGRSIVYKILGQYDLWLADQSKYYEIVDIQRKTSEYTDMQEIYDNVYNYFHKTIKPDLHANDEKIMQIWECLLGWKIEDRRSVERDQPLLTNFGYYGLGFLCLTDKNIRIISIGSLSKKQASKFMRGFGTKLILAAFGNYDMSRVESNDKFWKIPFKSIRGVYQDNYDIILDSTSEAWKISIFLDHEVQPMLAALELGRSGNLRGIIDLDKIRLKSKTSPFEEEDIFNKIERLATLKDQGVITLEEFEHKKKELLSRL